MPIGVAVVARRSPVTRRVVVATSTAMRVVYFVTSETVCPELFETWKDVRAENFIPSPKLSKPKRTSRYSEQLPVYLPQPCANDPPSCATLVDGGEAAAPNIVLNVPLLGTASTRAGITSTVVTIVLCHYSGECPGCAVVLPVSYLDAWRRSGCTRARAG